MLKPALRKALPLEIKIILLCGPRFGLRTDYADARY